VIGGEGGKNQSNWLRLAPTVGGGPSAPVRDGALTERCMHFVGCCCAADGESVPIFSDSPVHLWQKR
jgi:hypothetical protein